MPAMPRPNGQAKKIAYAIIGKPANMQKVRTSEKKKEINQRLVAQDIRYSR